MRTPIVLLATLAWVAPSAAAGPGPLNILDQGPDRLVAVDAPATTAGPARPAIVSAGCIERVVSRPYVRHRDEWRRCRERRLGRNR